MRNLSEKFENGRAYSIFFFLFLPLISLSEMQNRVCHSMGGNPQVKDSYGCSQVQVAVMAQRYFLSTWIWVWVITLFERLGYAGQGFR